MRRNVVVSICFVLLTLEVAFGQGSCTSPANAIVAENCNVGTTGWEVGGLGDLTIQGFATDISVDVGQTIYFKIDTPATSYHIDIYRMGYYGGTGGRYITTVEPSATLPQAQPACLTDPTTLLYDCGNWGISASWTVPTDAVSGIYIAAPVRDDTGGASQIVFVVRNDASTSAILFQTSDTTWQAYNGYGGNSVYGPTDVWDLTHRAFKVSYNRPSDTRTFAQEAATWVFGEEYPMVRFLEANGYDVSYFTGLDADRNGSLIKNHKLYLSVGHDEYWSGGQRTNVEAARDAGVNMAFFSGNEVFWKTRWENSIDGTNIPYRTLVVYKETLGPNSVPTATAAVDPLDPPTWTGTWRDTSKSPPDDGGRPENSLTGTIFMVNGTGTDNPGTLSIQVPAADGQMRFWRNTSLANLAAGQTAILPPGTLGYEWDEDLDNGARPAGTFDLSSATYTLTTDLLLDQGGTYGAGTATHQMTLHRAPSGALVFGAGSIQYAWGLDSNHDNPIQSSNEPADPDMQQATVNLFADMGIQPATLQPGLLTATQSTDTVPPASLITSPASGSTVRVGTSVNITGTAADTGGGVVGGVEVSVDGGTTWHPATGRASWSYPWTPSASGYYTIRSRATDDSANLETPSAGITVAASTTAQTLSSLTLNSSSVTAGNPLQGTVTLGQVAASGGVVVTLSSTSPSVASVPSSVTVPAGQFSATFTVTTFAVPVPTSATITAVYVATSSASLTVKTALPPSPGSVAIDAIIAQDQGTAALSVTSGAFSTSLGDELLLAFVAADYTEGLGANTTVTNVAGGGLTWDLVVRTNTQYGTAEIWRAFTANPLSNVYVTATLSQAVDSSMLVMSFAGIDTSGTNGSGAIGATASANADPGAPTASLTTTRNNSLVLGVGDDWDNAIARTIGANQTMLHQYLATAGDTYWMQMQSTPIAAAGTAVTINDTYPTADRYNLSIVEVLPAPAGTLSISGTISPSASGSGTTLTLSGTADSTTTANASGNYSFASLVSGSYVVTPSKTGVVFTPTSQSVTLSGASMTAVNFTAATLTSIAVTPVNPTVPAGSTEQFTATGTYSDGSTPNLTSQVTWSSSNTGVATVNNSGLASAIAAGSSIMTATLGSVSGNTTLTVQPTTLVITTTSLPTGVVSQPYSSTLAATGGTAPFSWSLANSTTLPPGLSLSSGGQITGTPTVAGTNIFTVQVKDAGTPQQSATQQLTIMVTSPPASYTIWTPATVPVTVDAGPDSAVELGVKFEANVNGTIAGVRFYKSSNNTGTHVANLWNSSGTLLSSATFTNETASGWQQANFSTPAAITANSVYVASYHTSVGHYSDDQNYFANSGVDSPPLQALQNGVSGSDGVFAYGSSSLFPSQGYNASNYWVDVVFVPSATLVSIALTPANPTIQVGATQQFTATGTYSDGSTQSLTSQATWSSSKTGVATISSSGLASGVAGGSSTIAATLGSVSGNTTLTVQPATLVITTTSLPNGTQGQTYTASLAASGGTPTYSWALVNNTVLPPGLALSSGGQITGTPTTTGSTFTVQVKDSANPPQTANQSLSITVDQAPAITSASSTTFTVGAAGSFTVTASGVPAPTSFAESGALPGGVTFTTAGVLAGTPGAGTGGTYPITITASNGISPNATQSFTLTVDQAPAITSASSTTFTVGGAGSFTVTASGVPVPTSFTESGALPSGVTFTTAGVLAGTPGAGTGGTYPITITASNGISPNATQSFTLTVAASGCPCSIAGTISGSGGNVATVKLAGAATATVTANGSGNYSFTGLASGTYTVTPTNAGFVFTPNSSSVTVSGANVTGVNFSSTAQLAIDQTVSTDRSSAATTIASPAFSTSKANELLLAFVAADAKSAGITVTGVTGAGLTWALVRRTNAQLGTAEIWRAFAPTTLASVSVTATLSQSVAASITVVTFAGVDTSGTGGSGAIGATSTNNANPGVPSASLSTTRNNSWVFGVGNDWDNAIARTLGANQTMVHQYLASVGDTYWVQRETSATPTSGTAVTINDTAPTSDRYNLSICEVLPAQ
jgi:hypothetical protein